MLSTNLPHQDGSTTVQLGGDGLLENPMELSYTLKTTLTRTASPMYKDPANELVFTTEVVVSNDESWDYWILLTILP